jgi:hypothetical protein
MADREWVWMSHPDVTEPAQVTAEAFDEVWAENGWTIVDEAALLAGDHSMKNDPELTLFDNEETDPSEEDS